MNEMVAKLDDYGKGAWIAVMVLGFVLFWPVGLAILAYLLWSGRMGCGHFGNRSQWQNRFSSRFDRARERMDNDFRSYASSYSSGNKAFDEYRSETLKRLEEEERQFRTFLDKLRQAKDKAEFDQFMSDRRNRPADDVPGAPTDQPQS